MEYEKEKKVRAPNPGVLSRNRRYQEVYAVFSCVCQYTGPKIFVVLTDVLIRVIKLKLKKDKDLSQFVRKQIPEIAREKGFDKKEMLEIFFKVK